MRGLNATAKRQLAKSGLVYEISDAVFDYEGNVVGARRERKD